MPTNIILKTLAENVWIRLVDNGTEGGYAVEKCTPKIMNPRSPYFKKGYAVVYRGESHESAVGFFEAELAHMKDQFNQAQAREQEHARMEAKTALHGEACTLKRLLEIEGMIGTVSGGYTDPAKHVLAEGVPVELVVAWKQHFEATVKLKEELKKARSCSNS
ncbi:hypothetical protein MYOV003v1_p0031 [Vibrio phage 207E48.1]|nr:hypothetical protein MYOV003v1_p0031 [Vibrio phage 207E48.1]